MEEHDMNIKWLAAFTLAGLWAVASPVATASVAYDGGAQADNKDRVFITNDDGSISLIERVHSGAGMDYQEVAQVQVGLVAPHWPANQYQGNPDWWWVGVPTGSVRGFKADRNAPLSALANAQNQMDVNTYTYTGVPAGLPTAGESFAGVTPNGKQLWNSAREIDEIQEIDSDPHSRTFGQILTHIKVPLSAQAGAGSATQGKMRPCDMSITPDGKYLFEPDLGGETVTAVDIKHRTVVSQLQLEPTVAGERVRPFMLTTNGQLALVETLEGEGQYVVLDVSDPYHMKQIKSLTQADGLGVRPETNEFTPNGKYAYLITNGSPTVPPTISVLDLGDLQIVNNIVLASDCQPYAGDFSNDGRHFFVACSGNKTVAVVDTRDQVMEQDVAVSGDNPLPRGVIVR
jgi:hypothetical protein